MDSKGVTKTKPLDTGIKYSSYNPERYEPITEKEIKIVPRDKRKTSEYMTQYEYTEVVSVRARQIESGMMIFGNIDPSLSPIEIAEREIDLRVCPLIIRRRVGDKYEDFEVNEMIRKG